MSPLVLDARIRINLLSFCNIGRPGFIHWHSESANEDYNDLR